VKIHVILRRGLLALVLFLPLDQAFGQTGTPPFLNILDFTNDGTASPLLMLQGGQTSSTVGAEITSQSTSSTTSSLPNLGAIMGMGFGGLSLVQTSPATTNGTTGTGEASPFFCISGNQWNGTVPPSGASVAAVWCLHVHGDSIATTKDIPDIIEWTRPTGIGYGNPTSDLTMLWPGAINLAAAGQITVGPNVDTVAGNVANILSTFTGQKTTVTGTSLNPPMAGPVTVEPGQLTSLTAVPAGATEGALQILQSYIIGDSTDVGRLACLEPAKGPQYISDCGSVGAAENWVGVFNNIKGAQGVSVTPLRYGRVPISTASSATFNAGDFVCKDDANRSYVMSNGGTPCPIGESIGIAVGDATSGITSHLVDLVPEASVPVTGYWTNGPTAGSVTIAMSGKQYVYGLVIPTPVVAGHVVLDVATADTISTDLYSVGIFNSSGLLVAHISPQAFQTTGVQAPIVFQEGTVTFSPGKYYLGLTGEATTLKLSSVASTLIPLAAFNAGSTTGGAQISSFTPPSDSWAAALNSEPVIALAP